MFLHYKRRLQYELERYPVSSEVEEVDGYDQLSIQSRLSMVSTPPHLLCELCDISTMGRDFLPCMYVHHSH